MKSLLLIATVFSFTIYKAGLNKKSTGLRYMEQQVAGKQKVNDRGDEQLLITAFSDLPKITTAEKQLKNKS